VTGRRKRGPAPISWTAKDAIASGGSHVQEAKSAHGFKREAVRLMLSRGERTVGDVARGLGVTTSDLHRWRDKYRDSAQAKAAPTETVEQENKRLRKEVERLRLERDARRTYARTPPASLGLGLGLGLGGTFARRTARLSLGSLRGPVDGSCVSSAGTSPTSMP